MIGRLVRALPRLRRRDAALMELVAAVNAAGHRFEPLTDDALRSGARTLRERAMAGEPLTGALKIDAFAIAREAARRSLGIRPYDVQVAGGLVMADGGVAEMKTGEGKTLTAAMPSFLFALAGKGAHVVTVNDYLARRDAEDAGRVHRFLGFTAAAIQAGMADADRKAAYAADVTYCSNSEVGFDTLRDNLRFSSSQMVQRGHHFAIVDEADSVLIDEARTPLVISAPSGVRQGAYVAVASLVSRLVPGEDWKADEKERSAILTEEGTLKVERGLADAGLLPAGGALYETVAGVAAARLVDAALKARALFHAGRDYVVSSGKAVIVDQSTGRPMEGRRFSDGVHEAIEAKEGIEIKPETHTLTSITYQNLFRGYGHLCGMTGTADTEREELGAIYGLSVRTIPTHAPVRRVDEDDIVFMDSSSRDEAVADAVEEAHAARRPVLVGTGTVDASERIAGVLAGRGWKQDLGDGPQPPRTFRILSARHHEREAEIVAAAGMPGAVTIATNMAGRGTDIKLGGDGQGEAAKAAREAGGLLVIGVGRNDNRRIDNQLRGRSGRQGDPGGSRFYVSFDDPLVKVWAPERMKKVAASLGVGEGGAISHPMVSRAIEKAQKALEARDYETRKNVVKYDDVVDQQRKAMHALRREVMDAEDMKDTVRGMVENAVGRAVDRFIPAESYPDEWDAKGLQDHLRERFRLDLPVMEWAREDNVTELEIEDRVRAAAFSTMDQAEADMPAFAMRGAEKLSLIQSLDDVWRQHLGVLEEMKASVGLRTVAQRDPLVEFRTDAYALFERTMEALADEVTSMALRIRAVKREEEVPDGSGTDGRASSVSGVQQAGAGLAGKVAGVP